MNNYEKPIVLANSELSEGVYAASGGLQGSSDYETEAYQTQGYADGNGIVFQVNGTYKGNSSGGANNTNHVVAVKFDKPVNVLECSGFEYYYNETGDTVYIKKQTGPNGYEKIVGQNAFKVVPTDGSKEVKVVGTAGFGS